MKKTRAMFSLNNKKKKGVILRGTYNCVRFKNNERPGAADKRRWSCNCRNIPAVAAGSTSNGCRTTGLLRPRAMPFFPSVVALSPGHIRDTDHNWWNMDRMVYPYRRDSVGIGLVPRDYWAEPTWALRVYRMSLRPEEVCLGPPLPISLPGLPLHLLSQNTLLEIIIDPKKVLHLRIFLNGTIHVRS